MSRLYRKLAVTFLISALLFVCIYGVTLYVRGRAENGRYLSQLLISVEGNLEHTYEKYEEMLDSLSEEYENQAQTVEYILSHDGTLTGTAGLEVLKGLMGTGDISLIDSSGKIFVSTNEELLDTQEEEDVMTEIREPSGTDQTACAVRIDDPEFREQPKYFYVVSGSDSDRFAAVRIDVDPFRADLKSGKEMVISILRQATTEYETSIFAVGKVSGTIFGITENNRQEIRLSGVEEGEQLLDYLEGLPKGAPILLDINGAYQNAVIRELDGMYLVAFSGLERVVSNVLLTFWIGLAAIGVISVLTILLVRFYLKKYFFQHFEQIRDGIYGILRGERDPEAEDSEIPELRPLADMIFRLEQEYVEKTQGIYRMEGQLSAARTEAEYDRLTGLYNRNGFERRAEEFLKREHPEGVLILFDLDNFKRINDSEGHPEGDRVLRQFGECLSSAFRRDDVIGRLGGDEFIVLIPNPVSAGKLEEKFFSLLGEIRSVLKTDYEKYRVSASIGAVFVDGTIWDYEKLYRCADTALYISKYLGKDRFYINDRKIDCMRRECIGCREDCPRSRILKEDVTGESDKR
ncbi:MAG TPA: GGDEF domain-containing protein [Candidatus Mediterraneibacter norfolkensis]|nr:GGDEF domain-containing protein [Candidatus Mediterraneibacter norfolkensis]